MQKVSQQKGVSTEIEMKTFFTHKTWNFDLIFLQFGQFGIVSVATWWYLLWLVFSQVPQNRMSHKFIEVEHLRYEKNHFKLYRLVTKAYICLRIRVRSRLSKTRHILKAYRLDYRKSI